MKQIITLIGILSILSCKAQNIVGIYSNDNVEYNSNYYLKDVDNDFNKFIGTWKYTNGNTSFTIVLDKEIKNQPLSNSNYQDMLVGEYQYIENGVEKANTLLDMDNPNIKGYLHKIAGYRIVGKTINPDCNDCSIDERRVLLTIRHPTVDDVNADLVLRYVIVNGVEQLEANLFGRGPGVYLEGRTDPLDLDVPYGDYVLIKQ